MQNKFIPIYASCIFCMGVIPFAILRSLIYCSISSAKVFIGNWNICYIEQPGIIPLGKIVKLISEHLGHLKLPAAFFCQLRKEMNGEKYGKTKSSKMSCKVKYLNSNMIIIFSSSSLFEPPLQIVVPRQYKTINSKTN